MPYYLNHSLNEPITGMVHSNTPKSGYKKVWRETSFRTRPPEGVGTKELKLSAVEPWTWHESYETLKARNFENQHPGTAFAKDRGHVWSSEKYEYLSAPLVGTFSSAGQNLAYNCYPIPNLGTTGISNWWQLSDPAELNSYGALAYTQASPLSEEFSLPAFVGELREGLPSLIPAVFMKNTAGWSDSVKGRLRDAKNAGSDYLNVQFGWIPLLNDVISIATALAKATVAITAMDEIHRYRELPEQEVTALSEAGVRGDWNDIPSMPSMSPLALPSAAVAATVIKGTKTVIQTKKSRMWFEGNFVKLPKASLGLDRHMAQFDWLINTDLKPSDLWQIAPWSWLVDWFIDIGGLIEAFQTGTSNRILSTYAYAMREESLTTTVLMRNIFAQQGGSFTRTWTGPKDYSCVMVASRKRRIRANPFGFTLNPSVSLSLGQQLILGALGLTKIK
jgi:hypothetical protein